MNTGKLTIRNVDHHRNGIMGNPFNVVLFDEQDAGETSRKVAIVFQDRDDIAVLDVDLLAQGNITFGENSWHGDVYRSAMDKAIDAFNKSRERLVDFLDPITESDKSPRPE